MDTPFDPKTDYFHWKILKASLVKFSEDDIFTHAAALSYYTIFSLPPMLLIILYTTTRFYNKATVEEAMRNQIGSLVGADGASELFKTIEKMNVFEPTLWATILGIGILIFTSTTVLVTMQSALNKIFDVKAKAEGWAILKMVMDRILSFALIIGIAFVMLVSLSVNAFLETFGNYLQQLYGGFSIILSILTTWILPFVVITLLFALMFKFLPDARLKWNDTWFGATLTSLLFMAGKYLISFYIGTSNVAGLYDAAGSIMVIMVWVFYASIIVMFGAVYTRVHTEMKGKKIKAMDYAVKVESYEIEKEVKDVK